MSKHVEQIEKLRDLPDAELQQALARATDDLFRLKLGHHTNQVENTMSIRGQRREVARIQTLLRARELGLEKQADKKTAANKTRGAGKDE